MDSLGSTSVSLEFYQEKQNAKVLSSGPNGIKYDYSGENGVSYPS